VRDAAVDDRRERRAARIVDQAVGAVQAGGGRDVAAVGRDHDPVDQARLREHADDAIEQRAGDRGPGTPAEPRLGGPERARGHECPRPGHGAGLPDRTHGPSIARAL
jgi:hypothetical protein